MNYLEYHKEWLNHYIDGRFRHSNWIKDTKLLLGMDEYSHFLAFTQEWKEEYLPNKDEKLECSLLDTSNKVIYKFPIYAAYEENSILDKNYQEIEDCWTLNSYFYEEHYCQCHRHTDAVEHGLNEECEGFECKGSRFLVQSITPPGSDLILYSETIREEELEKNLNYH
jgi:hypothetical protein